MQFTFGSLLLFLSAVLCAEPFSPEQIQLKVAELQRTQPDFNQLSDEAKIIRAKDALDTEARFSALEALSHRLNDNIEASRARVQQAEANLQRLEELNRSTDELAVAARNYVARRRELLRRRQEENVVIAAAAVFVIGITYAIFSE